MIYLLSDKDLYNRSQQYYAMEIMKCTQEWLYDERFYLGYRSWLLDEYKCYNIDYHYLRFENEAYRNWFVLRWS